MQDLEAKGIRVHEVVLFGSYARERARGGSDIDLAVISPQFEELNLRERYEALGLANIKLQAPIQAIGYAPRQWHVAERGSFIDEIRRTGRVVYRRGAQHPKRRSGKENPS